MPISLREPPDSSEDFELYNDFAMVHFHLDLVPDFNTGIKTISAKMN